MFSKEYYENGIAQNQRYRINHTVINSITTIAGVFGTLAGFYMSNPLIILGAGYLTFSRGKVLRDEWVKYSTNIVKLTNAYEKAKPMLAEAESLGMSVGAYNEAREKILAEISGAVSAPVQNVGGILETVASRGP